MLCICSAAPHVQGNYIIPQDAICVNGTAVLLSKFRRKEQERVVLTYDVHKHARLPGD